MKKFVALSLALTMALSLAACGGDTTSSGGDTSGTGESSSSDGVTLRLVNGKIEVDEQLKKLAELYKEGTGVTVEIQSMGGGIDIQSELKNYYQADNMPDIFVNGSEADFANWEGLLVDMSDQPWVSDTDQAYTDDSGAVLGFPYTTEAIGMAYNADILEKAGVDPSTLTTYSAYKEAFEKIDSMKDELGLTAVVDLGCESTNLYWSTGNHLFGQYLSAGLDRDDKTYIDLLSDGGQLDTERFTEYANFFQLLIDYSDPTMAVSGTYDEQILQFASGKYAFVTQGSWIGATMTSTDADAYAAAGNFEVGMAPFAFSEEPIETILTASPSWWSIYSGSEHIEEAKAFLNWCAGDTAQQVLVEEGGFISPFASCTYVASDPFALGIFYSLTDWTGIRYTEFVGLKNYITMFQSKDFIYSIVLTIIFVVINMILVNFVTFCLALLCTSKIRGVGFFRAAFFLPNLIGGIVLGYIWQFIFNKVFLTLFNTNFSILADANGAFLAIIVVYVWQYAGYIMMIYITGLQQVPRDVIEASAIDGASPFRTLFAIKIPMIASTFTICTFLTLTSAFKQFDVKQWDLILSAALLAMLPMIILFLLAQKQIMSGMVEGAIK